MQRELSFNTPYQLSLRMHLQYAGSTLRYRMCVATFDASLDIDVGDSVRRSGFDSLGSTHHPSILRGAPSPMTRSGDTPTCNVKPPEPAHTEEIPGPDNCLARALPVS